MSTYKTMVKILVFKNNASDGAIPKAYFIEAKNIAQIIQGTQCFKTSMSVVNKLWSGPLWLYILHYFKSVLLKVSQRKYSTNTSFVCNYWDMKIWTSKRKRIAAYFAILSEHYTVFQNLSYTFKAHFAPKRWRTSNFKNLLVCTKLYKWIELLEVIRRNDKILRILYGKLVKKISKISKNIHLCGWSIKSQQVALHGSSWSSSRVEMRLISLFRLLPNFR